MPSNFETELLQNLQKQLSERIGNYNTGSHIDLFKKFGPKFQKWLDKLDEEDYNVLDKFGELTEDDIKKLETEKEVPGFNKEDFKRFKTNISI